MYNNNIAQIVYLSKGLVLNKFVQFHVCHHDYISIILYGILILLLSLYTKLLS